VGNTAVILVPDRYSEGLLFGSSAIPTRSRVRFRVRDRARARVRVRVRVWIAWYMDAQTAARFVIADLRNSGLES